MTCRSDLGTVRVFPWEIFLVVLTAFDLDYGAMSACMSNGRCDDKEDDIGESLPFTNPLEVYISIGLPLMFMSSHSVFGLAS